MPTAHISVYKDRTMLANLLNTYSWYKLTVIFKNIRKSKFSKALPLAVIEAFIKSVDPENKRNIGKQPANKIPKNNIIFHINGKGLNFRIHENEAFTVSFLFFKTEEAEILNWVADLKKYIAHDEQNFEIVNEPCPEKQTYETVARHFNTKTPGNEMCIEFLTQFPFTHTESKKYKFPNPAMLCERAEKRILLLFGKQIDLSPFFAGLSVMPLSFKNSPKTRSGKHHDIIGHTGKLLMKGNIRAILPVFILASEIHLSSKLSFASGYMQLSAEPVPFFDTCFPDKNLLLEITLQKFTEYEANASVLNDKDYLKEPEMLASEIFNELKSGIYTPAPSRAFLIEKKEGGNRLIEQFSLKDGIVRSLLLKTLQSFFDACFEPESFGFRKGVSVKKLIETIEQNMKDAYEYILESDIENFFPSIDHTVLMKHIESFLPEKDVQIKTLLRACIKAPYVLRNRLQNRTCGISQGSPLSPLLANIYLNFFYKQIKTNDVRLIRYADDFIIMAKTKQAARNVLNTAKNICAELSLGLKDSKTRITHLSKGFDFLGMRFTDEGLIQQNENEDTPLKKPVYLTEPHTFIGIKDNALAVYKNKTLLQSVPLGRIAAIALMEPASFSTFFVKKCLEMNIPVTLLLNSAYCLTTINPQSKKYYDTACLHYQKYTALSDAERLLFAKRFSEAKLQNFIRAFKKRRQKNDALFFDTLNNYTEKINAALSIEELSGYEDAASKHIYARINTYLKDERFRMKKRDRFGNEPLNALLNFGYYLLFANINASVRMNGLNPYLGFLHSSNDRYESLVADIQELFRADIVRLILNLANREMIKYHDFIPSGNRILLNKQAKKTFILEFEKMMCGKTKAFETGLRFEINRLVLSLKNWILNGCLPFIFSGT